MQAGGRGISSFLNELSSGRPVKPRAIGYIDHDAPPGGRFRRALRLIGWNALLLAAGVALAALAGEAWFRLTTPFPEPPHKPVVFVPNVGYLRPPNTEIRHTNNLDFWNVSRTNSLGFLDREPPSLERARATCHVSIIGDSFVEASEVPMEDKIQVRLEELAADRLPHLDVTTSAFGLRNTGQVQQLPFYDEYARRLHPELLVLVFVYNDFMDNTPVLRSFDLQSGSRKRRFEPIVERRPDGKLELEWSLPHQLLSVAPTRVSSRVVRAARKVTHYSWFARWLLSKQGALSFWADSPIGDYRIHDLEALRGQPGYAALLEGWRPTTRYDLRRMFTRRDLPPFFEDALQYTRFALAQFRQRADRDGVELVILATHALKLDGKTHSFERMNEMAATLDIPVIDQADHILRQGAAISDARWPHDDHWNPAGHQWAAEALLEYIEQRPEVCDG